MIDRYTFRRNTHTRTGVYRGPFNPVLDAIGDGLYHWLDSDRGMSFEEWAEAIEADDVNFYHGRYGTPAEAIEDGRSHCPTRTEMAHALVAMLEVGIVEMVPEGWTAAGNAVLGRSVLHVSERDKRAAIDRIKSAAPHRYPHSHTDLIEDLGASIGAELDRVAARGAPAPSVCSAHQEPVAGCRPGGLVGPSTPLLDRIEETATSTVADASLLEKGPMRWEMMGRAEGLRMAAGMVTEAGPPVPRAAVEALRVQVTGEGEKSAAWRV